jgi:hypothetical protein
MADTREDRLEAKVKAFNRAGVEATRWQKKFLEIFAPYVGKKVLTNSGLVHKLKEATKDTPNTVPVSLYREAQYSHSLIYTVKTCESYGEHSCCYAEVSFYVGKLSGDVLTELQEPQNFRTQYTVKEITEKRDDYKAKKAASDAAMSALFPFGEFDN